MNEAKTIIISLFIYTKPKFLDFIAKSNLLRNIDLLEYRGMYNLDIQVFAVGKWVSSAGRMVTDGNGWNPSSDAGKAGDPVQKYTYNIYNFTLIINTTRQPIVLYLPNLVVPMYSFSQQYSRTNV